MKSNIWQFETLEQLHGLLQSLDLVVVVADKAIHQFFSDTEWLNPINAIYTTSQSEDLFCFTSRICFSDMRRLDLIFMPVSAFDDPSRWTKNPFQTGYHILFAKLPKIEKTRAIACSAFSPTQRVKIGGVCGASLHKHPLNPSF